MLDWALPFSSVLVAEAVIKMEWAMLNEIQL